MTILSMAKLRALAPKDVRRPLMKELTRVGCVEINSSAERLAEEDWQKVLEKFHDPSDADQRLGALTSARELLDKHAPVKAGLLDPRRQVTEQEFNNEDIANEAYTTAAAVNELGRQLSACAAEEGRVAARITSLMAWKNLDAPLDVKSGKYYRVLLGVSPAAGAPAKELIDETSSKGPAELTLISSDREQNYYLLMAHAGIYDEVMDKLKSKGFSIVSFKDVEGTAADNIRQLEVNLKDSEGRRLEIVKKIKGFAGRNSAIEQAIDVYTIESKRDQVLSGLAGTQKTLFLEGWVPRDYEPQVSEILDRHGCAYQFDEPEESDDVPILLHNNKYVAPFTFVTELFALPSYRSGLDPNPYMAPFFFIAFGIMTGDVMYGLLMTLMAWYMLKKTRPKEGSVIHNGLRLIFLCGISGIIWGVLFGGYFGNAVSAVTGSMFGYEIKLKAILYDPLEQPMTMFTMALAFGVFQICCGLCIKGYQLLRQNKILDAVSDVGFHLLLIIGAPIYIVNANVGIPVLATAALGIVLTGGREKKNIFMKFFGGLGSLYNCVNYLTDVLSYSRLLGLGLASAVIAQVMNTIATLVGTSVIGWIALFLIFAIGHTFNLALGLIGNFVHAARLQFIEFYGKFYEYGGRPFTPLFNNTKYVEMIKEAN
jgi:V/A-type H+-transporting ATPase subunit I